MIKHQNQNAEEISQKIEAIYADVLKKVEVFEEQQKNIVADYIKKLEQERIKAIEKSLSE